MTEVREITRSELVWASLVISSSVSPSEKYSCAASEERFTNGRTAMDWMAAAAAVAGATFARNFTTRGIKNRAVAITTIPADAPTVIRVADFRRGVNSGTESAVGSALCPTIFGGSRSIFRVAAVNR